MNRMVISIQAARSAQSSAEGSETRTVSSASNNLSHERPTSQRDEDIVRHPGESLGASLNG